MQEYVERGARLAWLIDIDARRAWVYRLGLPVEAIESATTPSGAPELPGFVLDVLALA